jgi:hypothetical protein
MKVMANNKKILLIIVVLTLAVGGVLYLLGKGQGSDIQLDLLEKEKSATFGAKIYEMVRNPAEKIPQINPFKTKINPFEGLKINPFK